MVAGNTPFSLSWDQEDLFPCGGWGSAPQTLVFNSHRQPEEHHAHACPPRTRWRKGRGYGVTHDFTALEGKGMSAHHRRGAAPFAATLKILQSIYDATECGLVLMGNESVYANLSGQAQC